MREVEPDLVPPVARAVLDLAVLTQVRAVDTEHDPYARRLDRIDVLHQIRVLFLGGHERVVRGGEDEVRRDDGGVEQE